MKLISIIIIVLFSASPSICQTNSLTYQEPRFVGGMEAFHEYLDKNLRYPPDVYEQFIEVDARATIHINENGKVYFVKVVGNNEKTLMTTKKVLEDMPNWNPGKLGVDYVDTSIVKIIYFSINRARATDDSLIFEKSMYSSPIKNYNNYSSKSGLSEYKNGVAFLENKNATEAIKYFNKADSLGLNTIDLFFNRGVAYYKLKMMSDCCKDWNRSRELGDVEALKLYNSKCYQASQENEFKIVSDYIIQYGDTNYLSGVDKLPQFPGSENALVNFLSSNIKYPSKALRNNIQGTVYCTLIISDSGYVTNVSILQSPSELLSKESIRVIELFPQWTPGVKNNKNINFQYNLPVKFTIKTGNYNYMNDLQSMSRNMLYNEGVKFYKKGNYKKAIENYNKVLELNSSDFDALFNCAACYAKLGEYKKACEYWRRIEATGSGSASGLLKKYCQ
jgi:periplasmic protein TonB